MLLPDGTTIFKTLKVVYGHKRRIKMVWQTICFKIKYKDKDKSGNWAQGLNTKWRCKYHNHPQALCFKI